MHRHSNTVQNSGETVQAEVYFGVLGLEVTDYCDSHMDFEMNFFERKGRTLCSSMWFGGFDAEFPNINSVLPLETIHLKSRVAPEFTGMIPVESFESTRCSTATPPSPLFNNGAVINHRERLDYGPFIASYSSHSTLCCLSLRSSRYSSPGASFHFQVYRNQRETLKLKLSTWNSQRACRPRF